MENMNQGDKSCYYKYVMAVFHIENSSCVFLEGDVVWGSQSNIYMAWRSCVRIHRYISDRCEMHFCPLLRE